MRLGELLPQLVSRLRWWRARFKIRRRVRLVTSEASLLPFTLGTLRPVIYLPETILRDAEPTVADAVIAHEMTHIKRGDDLWLRFYHPAPMAVAFSPCSGSTQGVGNRSRWQLLRTTESVILALALALHRQGRVERRVHGSPPSLRDLGEGQSGGSVTIPRTLAEIQSEKRTSTGAWSEGRFPLRSWRSISAAWERRASSSVTKMWSSLSPSFFGNPN